MATVGGQVSVAVAIGSGAGVLGGGTGVAFGGFGVLVGGTGVGVGGTGVSVGGTGVGVGGTGVSVGGPGVTVGHGVSVGQGCAPTEINGSDTATSKATVSEMTRLRKRIVSLPFASR